MQEYAKQNARENAAIQHQYGKEDRADAFGYDVKKMGIAQEYRKELKDIEFQMQEAHANNDVNRKFWYQSKILDLQNKYGAKENKNGITHEKAEVARKAITDIDKKLNEDFTLTDEEKKKLRNDRANYQYILDTYFFGGQGDSNGGGQHGGLDPANNYDDFISYYTDVINKNDGSYSKDDIYADAKRVNPAWAEDIKEYLYGSNAPSNASNTNSAPSPARPAPQVVYLPADESGDNPGGYADDTGTRGSIPMVGFLRDTVGNIAQNLRAKPIQTQAGSAAARRYGITQ